MFSARFARSGRRHLAGRVLVAALSLSAVACGGGEEADRQRPAETRADERRAAVSERFQIALAEQNESGQTGTATLIPGAPADEFEVALKVTAPKKFAGRQQHAHIHDVTCAEYAGIKSFDEQLGTVATGLDDLLGGRSRTTVAAPLSDYATGEFSINVHEQDAPYTAVVCGDIPKR